nr:MAG TPA: hypothetical protein [Caudoviricetes sp.]
MLLVNIMYTNRFYMCYNILFISKYHFSLFSSILFYTIVRQNSTINFP